MTQQQNKFAPKQSPVNWPVIVCMSASLPIELLFHDFRTFGVRSIGARVAPAVLLMFVFAGFDANENSLPLFGLIIATVLLTVIAQICCRFRNRRGFNLHSRYSGRPYATKLVNWSETNIKRLEPLLACGIGCIVHVCFNHPLGSFLIVAAICMWITVGIDRMVSGDRALDMNDQMIEQRVAMENLRDMRGDE